MALIPVERLPGDRAPPLSCPSGTVQEYFCGDPRCDCNTGHLVLGGVPMAVDVGTGRLDFLDAQAGARHPKVRAELEALVRGPGVLDRLRAHYAAVRRYGEEHHFEYVDWTRRKPEELVGWQQIFPREGVELLPILKQAREVKEGQAPEITEEDIALRIGFGDLYCVDPRCDCQRVHWNVVAMAPGERDVVRQLGAVTYDFRKRQPAVESAAPGVDPDQLLYTVLAALHAYPRVVSAYAERYRRLRGLIIPLAQRQRRELEAARSGQGKEVGRNDPCPCGSGKKYKKCHGAG